MAQGWPQAGAKYCLRFLFSHIASLGSLCSGWVRWIRIDNCVKAQPEILNVEVHHEFFRKYETKKIICFNKNEMWKSIMSSSTMWKVEDDI